MLNFQVLKSNITQKRWQESETLKESELEDDDILFAIQSFAFTANNVTYADLGESFKYWQFFSTDDEWGSIPCWGFAEVQFSKSAEIQVGAVYYGFFPMASHLKVKAGRIENNSFFDVSKHRAALPAVYNQYSKSKDEQGLWPFQMLFRPLFTTSFLLADYIQSLQYFDSKNIIITSASSKTAMGLAFILAEYKRKHPSDFKVIGLTSFANVYFLSQTGYYDDVLDYSEISELALENSILIDLAGSKSILIELESHLKTGLKQILTVGKSHWETKIEDDKKLLTPTTLFFAPAQAQKRIAEWGYSKFAQHLSEQMALFHASSSSWLNYVFINTSEEWELIYKHGISGGFNPESGYIINIGKFDKK
jgi:hypothetical protein